VRCEICDSEGTRLDMRCEICDSEGARRDVCIKRKNIFY
jgi:hypothetical protein